MVDLYLWAGLRQNIIGTHDFYVAQMKERILSQFDDLEGEADRYIEEVYQSIGRWGGPDFDSGEAGEVASDAGADHFFALSELREQVFLGGLAGMYHQWDKTLRKHLTRELRDRVDEETIEKIWNATFDVIIDAFLQFGWDVKAQPFFKKLDALQLIVNIYKHGNGRSLKNLAKRHKEHLEQPERPTFLRQTHILDYEYMTVADEHLDEFAAAIRQFWEAMPERLNFISA